MGEKDNQTTNKQEHARGSEQFDEFAAEQQEAMRDRIEQAELASRKNHENEGDAHKEASSLAKEADEKKQKTINETHFEKQKNKGAPSKKQLNESFNNQIKNIRDELGLGGKITSKIIHNPVIEAVSDFISSTLARPNALLSGSITAFITVTALYFLARHYGFQLSGFETIAAFIVGWFVGTLYDYLKSIFRKRKY